MSQGSLGQLGCPSLALEGRELSPSGWRVPAGNWPGHSVISLPLPSGLPRLERLQRIVSKLQMESGLCEEQLNQADTLLQSVSGRSTPAGAPEPRTRRRGGRGLVLCQAQALWFPSCRTSGC